MSKAYYKIMGSLMGEHYWWYLYAANGTCIAGGSKSYPSEAKCLDAINRLEEIVSSKPRCILPEEKCCEIAKKHIGTWF